MNHPPAHVATLVQAKNQVRLELKQIRAGLSPVARAKASARIMEHLLGLPGAAAAQTLFIYISRDPEVDTHALIRHALSQGRVVAVPRILPDKTMIAVRFTRWEELTPGELGILTLKGGEPWPGPFDLVITPGLGFSPQGHRLGYGRGYYDRWYATHPCGRKIGIAFALQVRETIPYGAGDVPMDIVITENRIITP